MEHVSVLLCAYNSELFISEAIDSVLAQTYKDFDLVLVDDGSKDRTLEIMRSYRDERIQIIETKHDYIRSLNIGLRHCHGEFIARLDADDIMEPTRLEEQVYVMHHHLDLAACFSWGTAFGYQEGLLGSHVKGFIPEAYFWLLTGNFLIHPSAMLRRSFIQKHHIRYKDYSYAEDYKLWADIAHFGGLFYVIPKPLVRRRLWQTQVSRVYAHEQWQTRLRIQQDIVEELLQRVVHSKRKNIISLYHQLLVLNNEQLIQGDRVILLMYQILNQIRYDGMLATNSQSKRSNVHF